MHLAGWVAPDHVLQDEMELAAEGALEVRELDDVDLAGLVQRADPGRQRRRGHHRDPKRRRRYGEPREAEPRPEPERVVCRDAPRPRVQDGAAAAEDRR